MSNTRFGGTILHSGTGAGRAWFRDLPQASTPDYVTLWDDFTGVAVDSTNAWTVVKDSGATVAIVADTAGGEIALTSATTTENDGGSIQGNEIFLPAAGRTIWFETRVKVVDADEVDIFVGLVQNFATNPEAALTASNMIGFLIADGSAAITAVAESADTQTTATTGASAVDATYVRLGFKVNGISSIEYFVNRQKVATITAVPTTEMAPALFHLSGSASGTHAMTADYVGCWATR